MHIAPGTENLQPMTNINWTLVLMTLIILIAIGTLIYLLVTIIEAMKDINKVLDQALTAQQLQAQTQGQQVQQGQMQTMLTQPATQTTQTTQTTQPTQTTQTTQTMNAQAAANGVSPVQHAIEEINDNRITQTAQTTNQQSAPSDKALNEAWKAGYESAKAQYESLQNMPAMPTNGDIANKSANTTDDTTNAVNVEPTETIVEDATPVEDTSSAIDEARESIDK